jgi:uncharacterized protein
MSNSSSKGTALITGASTGIGALYADRLAKRGYDLIIVARNEAQLKALAARLTKETGRSATPLRADLNDKADLAKVEAILRDERKDRDADVRGEDLAEVVTPSRGPC